MITYEHDRTLFHRLDPRSKLVGQIGFAVAAIAHDALLVTAGLTALTLLVLAVARLSPLRVLRTFRFLLVFLALAPLFATLEPGSPWIVPDRAVSTLVASYQVLLVVFVSMAYVRTTPVRETRAAIQRHVPGKIGQLLGVGISLVFRFFPLLFEDARRARLAIRARGGDELSTRERVQRIALLTIQRAFQRAQHLSLALRARCFAWNPTLPHLQLQPVDYPVLAVGVLLAVTPLFAY